MHTCVYLSAHVPVCDAKNSLRANIHVRCACVHMFLYRYLNLHKAIRVFLQTPQTSHTRSEQALSFFFSGNVASWITYTYEVITCTNFSPEKVEPARIRKTLPHRPQTWVCQLRSLACQRDPCTPVEEMHKSGENFGSFQCLIPLFPALFSPSSFSMLWCAGQWARYHFVLFVCFRHAFACAWVKLYTGNYWKDTDGKSDLVMISCCFSENLVELLPVFVDLLLATHTIMWEICQSFRMHTS